MTGAGRTPGPILLAALTILLLPTAGIAAERHVTFVFTGDNGGEVAPCG